MPSRAIHPVRPRESDQDLVEARPSPAHTDKTTKADSNDLGRTVVLNPAARVLWRDAETVQLELGPRALILDGVESELIALLTEQSSAPASGAVSPRSSAELDTALPTLEAGGFAWRRPAHAPPPPPPYLAGELAALRARHGSRGDQVLSDRSAATVVVHGTGRLAVALACLLGAANVGRISLHDSGDVHRHDSAPGGLLAADEGRRFNEAGHDAIRRAAPTVDTRTLGPSDRADLVVLTGDTPVATELRTWLHDRALPHLAVRTGADEAIVGPLVLPGLTSCLGCADLARLDRDPAWSLLAVQLCTPRRHADPSDLALTTLCASLAAVHILAFLEGDEPASLSGTLELRLPDWRIRRRSWRPHPDCDCGATGELGRR